MKKLDSIILIDDDEISNSLNEITIEELEIADKIVSFSDGEEAIEYLKSQSAQVNESAELLIVDLNMPGFNGEDFVVQFNNIPFINKDRIKIVIYSAILPGKQHEYLRNLGVHGFVEKPLTSEKISELIRGLGLSLPQ